MGNETNGVKRWALLMGAIVTTLGAATGLWAFGHTLYKVADKIEGSAEASVVLAQAIGREEAARVRADSVIVEEVRKVNQSVQDLTLGLVGALNNQPASPQRRAVLRELSGNVEKQQQEQKPVNELPIKPDSLLIQEEG